MPQRQITAHNWGRAPHNRIAFQQVQQLFPTARVKRGPGPISELDDHRAPVGPAMALDDVHYESADGSSRNARMMLESTYSDAFLIAHNGALCHEEYFGDTQPDNLHLLNSVTKSLTGMLAAIQMEDGLFSPNDRVIDHLPEFAGGAFENTTVRHLLDMTAAVEFGEDYADPAADFWKETAVVGWRPALVDEATPTTLHGYATSRKNTEQLDGEKYHYRTLLTNVLGMVIERTANTPLQDLMESRLWSRLGAEQDLAIVVDAEGFPYVGAGGNACARDLVRFGNLLANSGVTNGQQIIPQRWLDDTRQGTDEARAHLAASDYADMLPGGHYRNQVWVGDPNAMYAIGIHGQTIYINVEKSLVIVKLSSHPEPAEMALFDDTFRAMRAIADAH